MLVTQSCLTLCDPMDCSPPGSSLPGIFQARILEWVAIPFSRGPSWPRDWILHLLFCRWILYLLSHWGRHRLTLKGIPLFSSITWVQFDFAFFLPHLSFSFSIFFITYSFRRHFKQLLKSFTPWKFKTTAKQMVYLFIIIVISKNFLASPSAYSCFSVLLANKLET